MADLLLTLLLNAAFWAGIDSVVARCSTFTRVDRALATVVAGTAAIVVSLEALSVVGQINRASLSAICIAAGFVGLGSRFASARSSSSPVPTSPGAGNQTPRGGSSRWSTASALAALLLASWAALHYLRVGLLLPVEPVSDAPIYHLYFAIRWWKAGWLPLVPTPFGAEEVMYFPSNGDLWLTWLLTLGPSALVKVGQWPFLVCGAVALYGIARRAGTAWSAASIVASLWTGLPIVLAQAGVANVDLIWTSCYFTAVYFLLRWWDAPEADTGGPLAFFALACGLVVGTKSIGGVFVALLLPPAILTILRRPRPLRALACLATGILIPSGYWYARNVWLTGNPLYPLQLSLFGRVWAEGWYEASAMRATAYHVPVALWQLLVVRLGVVAGLAGSALAAAGVLAGWVQARRSSLPATVRRALMLSSTLAIAQLVIYWAVQPYNTQERFLSAALGLALIPIGTITSARPDLQAALCLVLGWQLVGPWNAAVIESRSSVDQLPADPVGRFYPQVGFAANLLPGWLILEREAAGTGARVAYAGTNLPYYLFGRDLRNDVQYININGNLDGLPHDYHRMLRLRPGFHLADNPWPQWYRADADFDAWLANLRRRRIELLFIARENRHGRLEPEPGSLPQFPIERQWADAHPELFVDLGPVSYAAGTIPWVRVYRLKSSP